uniref:Receptor kinase-like protein Xa21 n=1 Tax=Anthurium amnicola TaxID=1678845 RepID=A0A1D1ZHC1_9ARAE
MATPSKPSSFLKFGGEGCSTEPRPSCTPDVCSLFPVTLRAMELSSFAVWPSLLHARAVILLLFLLLVHSLSFCMCSVPPPGFIASPTNSPSSSPGRADDRLALLSFKSAISDDPLGATASWNESTPVCQWPGVTCGRQPPGRVTELVLDGHQLVGTMSPGLGNLTFLTKLHLPSNRLHGDIPWELGRLSRLQSLILSFNSLNGEIPSSLASCFGLQRLSLKANKLQGKIPANLSSCSELQVISFGENELAGKIPPELGSLSKLFYLNLSSNNLTGVIPPSLGNLSSLRFLYLSDNSLQEIIPPEFGSLSELEDLFLDRNKLTGEIPPQLGNLSNLYTLSLYENNLDGSIPTELGGMRSLETFDVYVNRLSGEIPLSLYNLSSLLTLQVGDNNLSGILPQDLGNTLPNLIFLHLFKNRFEGPIPSSLSNATRLEKIELSDNRFTGLIPSHLGALRHLRRLILGNNSLEAWEAKDWSFITSLANCRNLTELELYDNRLGGVLPTSIVNLSTQLTSLKLEGNQISGSIPAEIEKLVNLTKLHMSKNLLTGPIPATIGKLQNLQSLELGGNKFSGGIPSSLGKLSRLIKLSLGGNELEGTIPMDLGNCRNLQSLNLSSNRLNGIIPREVLSLSLLSSHLDLSRNNLTGSLPAEVGNLKNLNRLDVSENKLAGEIPVAIGQCAVLEYLHMEGNIFEGTIPQALCNLKGLQELDLSFNRLSGRIPVFLENLSLLHLNLSFNDFEGEVPHKGIFQNVSAVSLLGNTKLCGGGPEFHFQVCPMNDAKRRKFSSKLKIIVPVVGIVLLVVLLSSFIIYYLRKNSQNSLSPSELLRKHLTEISYAELHRSTDGFSSSNLIGMGSYGTVYRGKLGKDGEYVAVKVLNLKQLGASRSFITECDALKNVRHRNLVKIVTSCSGVDFEGHEFKALVYDLMPNGSLEEWLHPEVSELPKLKNLSFVQRLGVAIDVASAIDYLHQYVHISIIHSDLKPSNVLLDDRMTAHVGDFGLAMFLSSESSHYATCSVGLKGTIGYVAPEFGMVGKVSTSIDVYSYGILLLEMFTGKRPTDDIFKDGLTLHKFVGEALPDQVMDIVDLKLLSEEKDTEPIYDAQMTEKMLECLVSVFKLGLLCSKESHWERPKMGDISKALILTRDTFLGAECLRDKLSC